MRSTKRETMAKYDKLYYIDGILDKRVKDGQIEYLVKWENYCRNTWEPEHHLLKFKCDPFIESYELLSNDHKKNQSISNNVNAISAINNDNELPLKSRNNETINRTTAERRRTKRISYDISDLRSYEPPLEMPFGVTQYYGSYPHRYWKITNTKWYSCECGVKGNVYKLCGHFARSRYLNESRDSRDFDSVYDIPDCNIKQLEAKIGLDSLKCWDCNKINERKRNSFANPLPNQYIFVLIAILIVMIIAIILLADYIIFKLI